MTVGKGNILHIVAMFGKRHSVFSVISVLLHCSVMCIFPAVEDKYSRQAEQVFVKFAGLQLQRIEEWI